MNRMGIMRGLFRFSFGIFILGMLFRIMHWSGGLMITTASVLMILLIYPFLFYSKKEKNELDIIKLLLVEFWAIHVLLYAYRLPGQVFFQYGTIVLFVAWLIMGGPSSLMKEGNKEKSGILTRISPFMFVLCLVFIVIGSLFKIMHWQFADLLLIVGMSGLASWFIFLNLPFRPQKNHKL